MRVPVLAVHGLGDALTDNVVQGTIGLPPSLLGEIWGSILSEGASIAGEAGTEVLQGAAQGVGAGAPGTASNTGISVGILVALIAAGVAVLWVLKK